MLTAIILVCLITVINCTQDNAVYLLRTDIETANPARCLMLAEAYIAETSLLTDAGQTIRIACVRKRGQR